MEIIRSIQNRIYEIRGGRVMLDFDNAALYGVETRVLNQAVKRNADRFPEDFLFQLTGVEWQLLSKQIIHYQSVNAQSSQFVMISLPKNRSDKYLPSPKKEFQWSVVFCVQKGPFRCILPLCGHLSLFVKY